jgi:hypothetical protein
MGEPLKRQPFELQLSNDFTDDLVNGEMGAINDVRVLRDHERRGEARRIGTIARGDFVTLALRSAAPEAHVGRCIDVKFVGRVWKNDRANVTALDNQIVTARVIAHFLNDNSTDSGDAAYAGNSLIDAILAQVIRWIDIVNEDARVLILKTASDLGGLDSLSDARGVARINRLLKDVPGDRTINRTRIHIDETESLGKLSAGTALPRGGRPINSDNAMKIFPHVRN